MRWTFGREPPSGKLTNSSLGSFRQPEPELLQLGRSTVPHTGPEAQVGRWGQVALPDGIMLGPGKALCGEALGGAFVEGLGILPSLGPSTLVSFC